MTRKPVEQARSSPKYATLSTFSTVYGIGPVIANRLYDEGHRSIEDLVRRYRGSGVSAAVGGTGFEEGGKTEGRGFTMEEALRIRDELAIKSV